MRIKSFEKYVTFTMKIVNWMKSVLSYFWRWAPPSAGGNILIQIVSGLCMHLNQDFLEFRHGWRWLCFFSFSRWTEMISIFWHVVIIVILVWHRDFRDSTRRFRHFKSMWWIIVVSWRFYLQIWKVFDQHIVLISKYAIVFEKRMHFSFSVVFGVF